MSDPAAALSTAELPRLAELAEKLREDAIADAEVAELETLLAESAAAREAFAGLAMLANGLRHAHGRFPLPVLSPAAPRRSFPSFVRRRWLPLALAACLALAAVFAWRFRPDASTPMGAPIATISNTSGAVLLANERPVTSAVGRAFGRGELYLRTGLLEMTYANGVVIVLEAPARFDLRDATTLWLGEGNASARVPDGAQGFVVETASARIVDLGTEFGVSAKSTGSEVHVFKGEVLVTNPAEPNALRLTENRASRIDNQTHTPVGIAYEPELFVRTFEERSSDFPRLLHSFDPVAYYRMRITRDATLLLDVTERHLNGVIVPGSSRSTSVTGKIGAGLRLGGPVTQSYAVVRDFPPAPAAALSVCAWVRADSRPRWASIAKHWAKELARPDRGQFHFGLWNDEGSLEIHVIDGAGREVGVRDTVPLPLGAWEFVAFTHDGTTLRLYRNGLEIASTPCVGLSKHAPPFLALGAKLDATGTDFQPNTPGFWDGALDEVAIFHRALSAEQVRALYESAP